MESEDKKDNGASVEYHKKDKGPSFVETFLWYTGVFMLIHSIIYGIALDNSDKWFSRITVAVIALGFAGVIREIRKARK